MNRNPGATYSANKRVQRMCRELVAPRRIFASCFYGRRVCSYGDEKLETNVLLILYSYPPKVNSFSRRLRDTAISMLVVDRHVFETDVLHGKLGELLAERLALPYRPWVNPRYLKKMEVQIKKRFATELLEDLVRQYPELSTELLIQPEYFMYEVLRRRTKLFPPSTHDFSAIFLGDRRTQNIDSIMKGYMKALQELEAEKQVIQVDGYVRIDKDYAEATKRRSKPLTTMLISIRKALLPYLQTISDAAASLFQRQQLLARRAFRGTESRWLTELEETEKYLLMPTPYGPVSLSDKVTIQEFVRKALPGSDALKITVHQLGGALNSVFLIRTWEDHESRKIVVKKYEDWLGFKWFPLALWTVGTHSFAVLGATRLEREYAASQFLEKAGFHVPRILHLSLRERLIFKEFVEGEKVSEVIRRVISASSGSATSKETETIRSAGREVARIHLAGMALGDCKPENILASPEGRVFFLDLEQAERNGNQPWDVAEFLYYSGHYIPPTQSDVAARVIASAFVEGYLEAGGSRENVRKAAGAKYTKVFTIFTLPHVILVMANLCKKMGGSGNA